MIEIPGYDIEREIGRGGMASVYLARQTLLDREVALKVLAPDFVRDKIQAQRFLQEARMLAQLNHPHVVAIYDVGTTGDGVAYFSMQKLDGGDFGRRMAEGISEEDLIETLVAVAAALGYAHERGYVHRDVTPGNIMFDGAGKPVLTDFGIALRVDADARMTAAGHSIGTGHYMSPEQARGQAVDARSDLYSLGVVAFEALSGHPPFAGADGFAVAFAHVHDPIPRLPRDCNHWQPWIDSAMAKKPEDRFRDSAQLISRMRDVAPQAFSRVMRGDRVQLLAAKPAPRDQPGQRQLRRGRAAEDSLTEATPWFGGRALAITGDKIAVGLRTGLQRLAESRRQPLLLAAVLAAALVVLLLVFGLPGGSTSPADRGLAADATSAATKDPTPTPSPAGLEDSPGAATGNVDAAASAAVASALIPASQVDVARVPTVRDPVLALLAEAEAAVAAERLTRPTADNAYDRYLLVENIEPGNREARAGIEKIVRRYVELALAARRTGGPQWQSYAAQAEMIVSERGLDAALLGPLKEERTKAVAAAIAEGEKALLASDRDAARAAFERALALDPDNSKARDGLKRAGNVGGRGYAFNDPLPGGGEGPKMVVVDRIAVSRTEVTVAEFQRYWQAAGKAAHGGSLPSCRDREALLRASRKRSWQDPGYPQTGAHPVVCVSYAMAESFAKWLARQSGEPYRLPDRAELARLSPIALKGCRANVRDLAYQKAHEGKAIVDCDDGAAYAQAVGRFEIIPPGIADGRGNVREWTSTCEGRGCRARIAYGDSWASEARDINGVGFAAGAASNTIGFRVARVIDGG